MKRQFSLIAFAAFTFFWMGCAGRTGHPPIVEELPASRQEPNPEALDHFIRGVVLDQQGEVTRAIGEYRQALKYDSTSASIYQAMAEDYYALKLYDDAIIQLYAALKADTTNAEAMEFLSDLLMETGGLDSAISMAQRLIAAYPDVKRYRNNLAGVFVRLDRLPEAIEQYRKILDLDPSDIETLNKLSTLYIAEKDYQKALGLALESFAKDSTDDRVCFTIANLYAEQEDTAAADSFFSRAVDLNSGDPRYFINWAYLQMNGRRYDQAISILEKGTIRHPQAANMWALLGSAYEREGQDSLALGALHHSLELDSSRVGPYVTLGFLYDNNDEFDKAAEVYEAGLKIAPDDPLLLNNYAYLLATRKVRLEEALEMSCKSIELVPDNPSYLDTMGWIYYGMGDYPKAREYLEKAQEKDSENPVILDHLGDVFDAQGDKVNARANWRSALEFDPDNVQIREKLTR